RVGDVAKVDNVVGLPAEPFAEPVGDFAFGRRVVAADEQVVVARHTGRSNHDVAVHRIERLHDAYVREFPLHLFAERVRVADAQRGRHAAGSAQRIAHLHENLAAQILHARRTQCRQRVRAVGAVNDNVAKGRCVGERADLRRAADATKPLLACVARGGARAHLDLMAELNEFGPNGVADHACAEDCDLHHTAFPVGLVLINATGMKPTCTLTQCVSGVSTTRNNALPLIMCWYASSTRSSGNTSVIARTPLSALKASVSCASMAVPEYQPFTERRPMIKNSGETSSDAAAPTTIHVSPVPRPPCTVCIASPLVTVVSLTCAPPSLCSVAAMPCA